MKRAIDREILSLIDNLYSCADGDAPFEAFLSALGDRLGASVVGLTTGSSLQAVVGVDPEELIKYQTHYIRLNPWLGRPDVYPEGGVLLSEEILTSNAYRRTCFYNEWGKKNLVCHSVGGAVRTGRESFLFLSINRGDDSGPYGEPERDDVLLLMPHLRRAATIYEKINALSAKAWIPDKLAYPVLLLSQERSIRWANDAAERVLKKGDGLFVLDGKVRAERADEDRELAARLDDDRRLRVDKANSRAGWMRITQTNNGSQLLLFITRAPDRIRGLIGKPDQTEFLVFIATHTQETDMLANSLRQVWALTPAETALAIELLDSDQLTSAAEKLRISRNTAKSQLSSIFRKSGTRRQAELLTKLHALASLVSFRQDSDA